MSFNVILFEEKISAVNGHFERFKTSTLHTLIALLNKYPAVTTPKQIAAELARIPQDKQTKYKDALDYLRGEMPMGNFGVTQAGLRTTLKGQTHVVPNSFAPPTLRPDIGGKIDVAAQSGGVGAKTAAFDQASRRNVVLSGHGCWAQAPNGDWPVTKLKKGQEIRYYCAHYIPLGNDVGQRIDSHQDVTPHETIVGPANIFNYTLQEKGSLALLNRMQGKNGNQLDGRFVTVDANTLLDTFINDPCNATAVFHWAACRVVFNNLGQKFNGRIYQNYNYTTKSWF